MPNKLSNTISTLAKCAALLITLSNFDFVLVDGKRYTAFNFLRNSRKQNHQGTYFLQFICRDTRSLTKYTIFRVKCLQSTVGIGATSTLRETEAYDVSPPVAEIHAPLVKGKTFVNATRREDVKSSRIKRTRNYRKELRFFLFLTRPSELLYDVFLQSYVSV